MMFKKRINADEARELFLNAFQSISDTEILPIGDCDSRIVAEDIIATINVPHYRRAAMDGFAVRASDTLGAGSNSPVVLNLGKGEKGTCVRVHTGSPIPESADAVVMIEDTVPRDNHVEIFTQLHPFKNVGEIGEDIQKGEIILKEGHRLRPCDIAVLAMLGIKDIKVFRKPHVAIIPTGEELVSREKSEIKEGEVYETNGLMALLYIRKWGGAPRLLDIVTDEPEMIKEAIASNLDADMVITSGGTSVGKRDYVPEVVASIGKLLVHGVGISPGKPTALGIIKGKPVVCMPGYPVAGIVSLYFFARAALRKLGHIPDEPDRTVRAVLSEKIVSRIGYKTFARVKLSKSTAIPIATSGAGILSSVSKADGFVIIPENVEGYGKGEELEVVLIE
ncbi:MAG: molybdopterin molybdotransferase MoeA [Euryarchaeota archaeon]|nr:molybdopterin molybdotransferase MoeA [Euryarchaeota archaeon]MCG2728545.1 molybdopterin molybdotransferase MoeA [Candidatus Methanoperedenaceae archaeon]